VDAKATDEWFEVSVLWNGGACDLFHLARSQGVDARIAALRATGAKEEQIEKWLREEGVTTRRGHPISRPVIWRRLRKMGMKDLPQKTRPFRG
jgi:hypothetical protein